MEIDAFLIQARTVNSFPRVSSAAWHSRSRALLIEEERLQPSEIKYWWYMDDFMYVGEPKATEDMAAGCGYRAVSHHALLTSVSLTEMMTHHDCVELFSKQIPPNNAAAYRDLLGAGTWSICRVGC